MTTELHNDKIQRFFDGELSATEAAEFQAQLDSLEGTGERSELNELNELNELGRLNELINVAANDLSADIDSEALFARIESGIAEDAGADLISLADARRRRRKGVGGTVFALAAAAAIAFVYLGGSIESATTELAEHIPAIDLTDLDLNVDIDLPPAGSEVEEIDFGLSAGTVFAVEGLAGEPIAVVWINDEEGVQ